MPGDDESDETTLSDAMPPYNPGLMLHGMVTIPRGWTEWHRYKTSRYREVVVSRRRNPFGFLGPVGVFYGVVYLFALLLPWWDQPGPADALRYGIAPETVFGLLPIASACLILAWAVAAVVVRRRTREEEQFDRDRMYPPAEYWEAQDGD